MTSIVIELPLPSPKVSPNARPHYMAKARAVRVMRDNARIVARHARHSSCPWPAATVLCVFTFRDRRQRDRDNLLASIKAYSDGIADAGVVENDCHFTFLPVQITEPNPKRPGVQIIVTTIGE